MSEERIVKLTPGGKPITHGGSGNAYASYGCRCAECKAANTKRAARRRSERDSMSGQFEHGRSGYVNWSCRCDVCSLAHKEGIRRESASRKERGLPKNDPRHGRRSTYTGWSCRCELCSAAQRDYRLANK